MEKHAGHTFHKGVTLPHQETLIKWMQQKHNIPAPEPIPVVLENGWHRRQARVSLSPWRISHCTSLALWTDDATGSSPGSLSVW
jgi:hypothetical protein